MRAVQLISPNKFIYIQYMKLNIQVLILYIKNVDGVWGLGSINNFTHLACVCVCVYVRIVRYTH